MWQSLQSLLGDTYALWRPHGRNASMFHDMDKAHSGCSLATCPYFCPFARNKIYTLLTVEVCSSWQYAYFGRILARWLCSAIIQNIHVPVNSHIFGCQSRMLPSCPLYSPCHKGLLQVISCLHHP